MKPQYKAYLLRLHRDREDHPWRATLENAHQDEVLHFASERELLRYLMQVLTVSDSPNSEPNTEIPANHV